MQKSGQQSIFSYLNTANLTVGVLSLICLVGLPAMDPSHVKGGGACVNAVTLTNRSEPVLASTLNLWVTNKNFLEKLHIYSS